MFTLFGLLTNTIHIKSCCGGYRAMLLRLCSHVTEAIQPWCGGYACFFTENNNTPTIIVMGRFGLWQYSLLCARYCQLQLIFLYFLYKQLPCFDKNASPLTMLYFIGYIYCDYFLFFSILKYCLYNLRDLILKAEKFGGNLVIARFILNGICKFKNLHMGNVHSEMIWALNPINVRGIFRTQTIILKLFLY